MVSRTLICPASLCHGKERPWRPLHFIMRGPLALRARPPARLHRQAPLLHGELLGLRSVLGREAERLAGEEGGIEIPGSSRPIVRCTYSAILHVGTPCSYYTTTYTHIRANTLYAGRSPSRVLSPEWAPLEAWNLSSSPTPALAAGYNEMGTRWPQGYQLQVKTVPSQPLCHPALHRALP